MAKQPWTLEFYTDLRGKSPIREFIDNLPLRERNAVRRYLDRLEKWGTGLGMPYARHLRGPIWELRPPHDRFLYTALPTRRIVVLHAHRKQKGREPKQDIELALRRLAEMDRREGRG